MTLQRIKDELLRIWNQLIEQFSNLFNTILFDLQMIKLALANYAIQKMQARMVFEEDPVQ